MAGNHVETLETSLTTTTTDTAIRHHWSIEYARFFHYPTTATTTQATDSTGLKQLPDGAKKRRKGTWISSSSSSSSYSSMASLHLLTHESLDEVLLIISFHGKVNEEHFISKLHFSWPQVSCLANCPIRGSRVVFASYRDGKGQMQKFAMRFSTSNDSQTFISCLKDNLPDGSNVGISSSKFRSEVACPSEFISVRHSADEELSYAVPVGSYPPPHQSRLNSGGVPYTCSENTTVAYGLEPPKVPEEADLKSQDVRYMTDSSFYDMLGKIESVIEELGGDLSL